MSRAFGPVHAVDGLTLTVPQGIIFGFLGPNGSGKTTTIHLLLGLLEADAGRARVLGFDPGTDAEAIRSRSGALLEFNGLYERMSAEENLEFFGRVYHLERAERRARIETLLRHISLWERRKEPVKTWSRGMKQKLAVARSLLHRPSLLFLDEPTAGFDPVAAADLRDELRALVRQEGITIFLNTHNLAEAEHLCARVGVIRKGRLLAVGSPADLRRGSESPEAVISGSGFSRSLIDALLTRPDVERAALSEGRLVVRVAEGRTLAPIVRMIVESGGEIEEVRREAASLEEVFLTLVREESGS